MNGGGGATRLLQNTNVKTNQNTQLLTSTLRSTSANSQRRSGRERPIIDIRHREDIRKQIPDDTVFAPSVDTLEDDNNNEEPKLTEKIVKKLDRDEIEAKLLRLMDESVKPSLKIAEIPIIQRNTIEASYIQQTVHKPVFKDLDVLNLKVPLYYKITGYKHLDVRPLNPYSKTYDSLDFSSTAYPRSSEEFQFKISPETLLRALENRDSYYISKLDYNRNLVPLQPKVLTESDPEYYFASKNQNAVVELLKEKKEVRRNEGDIIKFQTFSSQQKNRRMEQIPTVSGIARRTSRPLAVFSKADKQRFGFLPEHVPYRKLKEAFLKSKDANETIHPKVDIPSNILAQALDKFAVHEYYPQLHELYPKPVVDDGKKKKKSAAQLKSKVVETEEQPPAITVSDSDVVTHVLSNLTEPVNRI